MSLASIAIPSLLKLPNQTWRTEFKVILPEFVSLTPIQGWLTVQHQGTYLRVSTEAKTIITLPCDRCLQQFNHRLTCGVEELIWLESEDIEDDGFGNRHELDLLERLPAQGEFDSQDWLYQQLCLSLRHPQICQVDCRGLVGASSGKPEALENKTAEQADSQPLDHRWASLVALKEKLEG